MQTDTAANRKMQNYSKREWLLRLWWMLLKPLFRFSPFFMYGWRRWILTLAGAKLGRNVRFANQAQITFPWQLSVGEYTAVGADARLYNLGAIRIGARVTISQMAHLCAGTHDYNDTAMPLIKSTIVVEDDAWICADAFVGPDVVVGQGAVVGARAVVMQDVPAWAVMSGNPATCMRQRTIAGTNEARNQ